MKESGFYQIFKENREKIINAVKARYSQTKHDIPEYSKDVLLNDFINAPIMEPIKEYAFKNSINIKIILEAAFPVVRDEVIKSYNFNFSKNYVSKNY